MKSAEAIYLFPKAAPTALLMLLLLIILPITLWAYQGDTTDLGKTKSIAEMQHEIVMLLIKKKDYDKALAEANKIFDMKWPQDQEPLLLKELIYLSDQFLRQGQGFLGLQLLERNSKRFKSIASQVAILKEKGYLFKSLGQDDKAIESFRRAQELENRK